jgi:methionyl-tRNA formyltransferase
LLKVHRAKVLPADGKGNPGEVVRADAGGFWVGTGAGILGLEEVQLENKRRLPGAEFIKGARIKTGDRF